MNTLRQQADEEMRAADMGISGPDETNISFSNCLQQLLEACSPEMVDESLLRLLRETFQTERVSFYHYRLVEREFVLCAQTDNLSHPSLPSLLPSLPAHRIQPPDGSLGKSHQLHILPYLAFTDKQAHRKPEKALHTAIYFLRNTTRLWAVLAMESYSIPGRKSQVEITEYYRDSMQLFACLLQKRVNESLHKKVVEAEQSARRKMAFLANMSHDIRTPLNAIVGFSKLLAETDEATEKKKYYSIIEKNNELLLQLISDILDLSKIEAGTVSLRNTTANLNDCFTALIESVNSKLGRHVVIDFTPALPACYILTDPNRLMQVIGNFLNNAVKFTSVGVIRLGYVLDRETLEIFVEDSGIGIPQAELESIFNPYVRLNSDFQGTGLGLAICKSIVEMMQGTIGASSQLGAGSRFWCKIPYQPIEQ